MEYTITSTDEFKEKRFAKIESRHYETAIQTIDSQIDDLILDKAQTLVEGYTNLVKQYGVRTTTGMELDTSKTFFHIPAEPNHYLQKIVRTCGVIYFVYGSNEDPSTKKRLEHFPDDVAMAQLLDDLTYYFENL